jgi:hypothetical protein
MSARLTAIGAILGVVVAAAVLTSPGAAQVGGDKGVFSTLRVGQLVEVRTDPIGLVITVYEDAASKEKMTAKIVEIGHDYVAVQFPVHEETGFQTEARYPVTSITAVSHARKKADSKTGPKKKP